MLAGVLLVGTLTTLPAQAATRDWGPLYVSIPRGDRQAEASGTAGWRDGQPYVWARFRDYNGTGDNDLTFVQAAFYKYESWVCGPNGFRCYGYRLQDTKRTAAMTYDTKWAHQRGAAGSPGDRLMEGPRSYMRPGPAHEAPTVFPLDALHAGALTRRRAQDPDRFRCTRNALAS